MHPLTHVQMNAAVRCHEHDHKRETINRSLKGSLGRSEKRVEFGVLVLHTTHIN